MPHFDFLKVNKDFFNYKAYDPLTVSNTHGVRCLTQSLEKILHILSQTKKLLVSSPSSLQTVSFPFQCLFLGLG